MVILDTNIVIDHLRRSESNDSLLMEFARNRPKEELAISVITVQELYEGKSTLKKEKEEYLLATIAPLKILPYSYDVAQKAGEIARDSIRSIELADAAIAATAVLYACSLATLDQRDFRDIPGIDLVEF